MFRHRIKAYAAVLAVASLAPIALGDDATPRGSQQQAVEEIKQILDRHMKAGERRRQAAYHGGFFRAGSQESWLWADDGSGDPVGLSFAIDEDLGCGCCYAPIDTDVSDDDLRLVVRLARLEQLSLQRTQVTRVGLERLTSLKRLRSLDLSHTSVSDDDLDAVAQLATLEKLDLQYTSITDDGLRRLTPLKNLREIDFTGTEATGEGLDAFRHSLGLEKAAGGPRDQRALAAHLALPDLETLEVPNLTGKVRVADRPRLKRLSVGSFRGIEGDVALANLTNLENLGVNTAGRLTLQDLPSLTDAYITTPLTRDLVEQLATLPELRRVTLRLRGETEMGALEAIGRMRNLERLEISGAFTEADLEGLQIPPNLSVLSLTGANLPAEKVSLITKSSRNLTSLWLSGITASTGHALEISRHSRLANLSVYDSELDSLVLARLTSLKDLHVRGTRVGLLTLDETPNLPFGTVAHLLRQTEGEDPPFKHVRIRDSAGREWGPR